MEKQIEDIFDKEKIETPKGEIKNTKRKFIFLRFFKKLFSKKSSNSELNPNPVSGLNLS
jgi:hypothetical protein